MMMMIFVWYISLNVGHSKSVLEKKNVSSQEEKNEVAL